MAEKAIPVEHGSDEWHLLRRQNVGSSEAAALLNMSKFTTLYQLHHEKAGTLPAENLDDNERVMIGSVVEPAIAEAATRKFGVKLRKVRRYITHPHVVGMGASLDFEQLTEDAGWVPAEIKNIDWLVFQTDWAEHEDYGYMPPQHYLVQLQHQLACTAKPYGYFYALVGGTQLIQARIPRHDRLIAILETAVKTFWDRVKAGTEPPVDYYQDREAMQKVYLTFDGEVKDLTDDEELAGLMDQYRTYAAARKVAEDELERIKASMFVRVKDHEKVLVKGGSINCALKEATPERSVLYKAQPARRELRVYPKKGAKSE
jgi:putative phage-type endonuclease